MSALKEKREATLLRSDGVVLVQFKKDFS